MDERRSKIVRNRVVDCRLSPDCKLFLVALVSDCFCYVFSRPILNKTLQMAANKNVNTIDERGSRIARNRALDCHLSPDWRQMAIQNTVSSDLRSAFIDCSERFRLSPVRYDKGAYFMLIEIVWSFLHKTLATIYLNLQTMSLSGL